MKLVVITLWPVMCWTRIPDEEMWGNIKPESPGRPGAGPAPVTTRSVCRPIRSRRSGRTALIIVSASQAGMRWRCRRNHLQRKGLRTNWSGVQCRVAETMIKAVKIFNDPTHGQEIRPCVGSLIRKGVTIRKGVRSCPPLHPSSSDDREGDSTARSGAGPGPGSRPRVTLQP
jgi:hypothetical protein